MNRDQVASLRRSVRNARRATRAALEYHNRQQPLARRRRAVEEGKLEHEGAPAMNEAHDPNGKVDVPSIPAENDLYDPNVTTAIPSGSADPLATIDQARDPLGTTDQMPGPAGGVDSHSAVSPGIDTPAGDLPTVPGYRVLREIARGGMGRVLAALDLALDRDVALKVLLPGARAERFVRESKITARLPHPGIPPVHALGTLADGSPFLAMKLIAGQTLAEAMKTGDRPRLLEAFTQVCQAVGFAHSRGIIHRDLKPANVMVGSFGEVQVMDWGLAKDLTGHEVADESCSSELRIAPIADLGPDQTTDPRPLGESTDDRTQAGQVMGTPAFMAPEQARGEATDARADVFALGGILCAILTGQAPYSGKSILEVLHRAASADLVEANARLAECGTDAELVALCRDCLAAAPEGRPQDAGAVAARVAAHQAAVRERLRRAELERAEARVQAEEERKRREVERQRRRAQLGLAGAVLLLVAGAAGGALWYQREQAHRVAEQAMRQAEADRKRGQAEQELRQAMRQAQNARQQLLARLGKPGGVFKLLDRPADWSGQLQAARAAVRQARTVARSAEGLAEGPLGAEISRMDALLAGDEAEYRLALALEQVRLDRATPVGGEYNHASALAAYRQAFGRPGPQAEQGGEAALAEKIRQSPIREQLVAALDDWCLTAWLAGRRDLAGGLLALACQSDPDPVRNQVRDVKLWQDRSSLAKLAGLLEPDRGEQKRGTRLSPQMYLLVGYVLFRGGAEWEPWLRAGQAAYPADFWLNLQLGTLLWEKKRPAEAGGFLRVAVAVRPHSCAAHTNLGNALADVNDQAGAIRQYRQAIALKPDYALAHSNLGRSLLDKGELGEAIQEFRRAIEIDPKHAPAHNSLGRALRMKGDLEGAIREYRRAIDLNPSDWSVHHNLGNVLRDQKDRAGAIAAFRQAIHLNPRSAQAHYNLGEVLQGGMDVEGAIREYRQAIELDPKLAQAHTNLGNALRVKGDLEGAIREYRRAVELAPKDAVNHGALGQALLVQGEFAAAHKVTGQCLQLLPQGHPMRPFAQQQLRVCEHFLALDGRLAAVLEGKAKLTGAAEGLAFAQLCQHKRQHVAAARFYAEAFAADSKLGDDLQAGHRYNAACSAALAAAGQGKGAARLDDKERPRLRKQALDWLRANLALWTRQLESGKPAGRAAVQRVLRHWQKDTDLAGLRDAMALAKLPADEQKACTQLWYDVAALLKKAEEKTN
jgi:serine/threonine protein kinase/Flp pilus assembly protein TadD